MTNDKILMSNVAVANFSYDRSTPEGLVERFPAVCEPARAGSYDLEERTARFGESVIRFAVKVPVTPVTRPLIDQAVRASTSVGANYVEADGADTRRDFRYKVGLCKREAKETRHWLRMLKAAEPEREEQIALLWQEALELARIFSAIIRSTTPDTV